MELMPMYNAMNFSYTQEWLYSGPITGVNPIEMTVNKASVATLLCPSDGVFNTCSGDSSFSYQCGNFNYVANTGHPRNVLLPGDPPNGGSLPPLTGIISMSRMYLGQWWCDTTASDANTNINVTLASITDGTSNTAAVSESLVNDGIGQQSRPQAQPELHQLGPHRRAEQSQRRRPRGRPGWPGRPDQLAALEHLQGADLGLHRRLGAARLRPPVPAQRPPDQHVSQRYLPLPGGGQRHEPHQQPPRRRQRLVHGRLGPLHQELGQSPDLVVHGHAGTGRDHLGRQLLSRAGFFRSGVPRMSLLPSRVRAAALVMGFVLSALAPGCGPAALDVDKSAQYTPESLAQELAFRYGALKPEARKLTRKIGSRSKSPDRTAALERARAAEKKGGDAPATKKRSGPQTIDDVLEDIDSKIDKIRTTPRAETCQKMIEALSKESSLTDDDRKRAFRKAQGDGRRLVDRASSLRQRSKIVSERPSDSRCGSFLPFSERRLSLLRGALIERLKLLGVLAQRRKADFRPPLSGASGKSAFPRRSAADRSHGRGGWSAQRTLRLRRPLGGCAT